MRSFSRNGTPRKGPSGSAREAASARAFSKRGMMTAFSPGLVRSMRAIAASTSRAGLAAPRRPGRTAPPPGAASRAGSPPRECPPRGASRRPSRPEAESHASSIPYSPRRPPPAINRPQNKHDGGRIRDPSPAECKRSDRTYEQTSFGFPAVGLLVHTQAFVALGWLVFTVKLVAVPAVVQITPPEPVKPGSALQSPEAYVLVSTNAASWAVAALRASA